MSQSTINKIAAAIQQYELDRPPFQTHRLSIDYHSGAVSEQKLLRKLDIRLLPVLSLFFFIAYLDRGNVSNALTEGMMPSLHLTESECNNCLMIFFISYWAFEVPSNVMSKKTTPAFWIPTIMCCWGVVMTCMGLIVDYRGLFWSRFFLGAFEAGIFPGMCFYLSTWYRASELQFRLALFFACGSAAASFGGLLAWCIGKMDKVGGMEGWRWIFVLEGCTSVVVGTFGYMFLCSDPSTADFLNEKEKEIVIVRIKGDEGWSTSPDNVGAIMEYAASERKQNTWRDIKLAFLDWQSYLHAIIYLCISVVIYGISLYLPTLMREMGYKAETAQLLTIPIYISACIMSLLLGIISDKLGSRSPTLIFCFFMMFAGYVLVLVFKVRDTRHSVAYAGMFVSAIGAYGAVPSSIAWLSNNSMGSGKRNVSLAIQIGIGNLGGVLSSYLHDSRFGEEEGILMLAGIGIIAIIINVAVYRKINKHRKQIILRIGYHSNQAEEMISLGDRSPFFEYTY